jgi:calnexin
MQSDITFDNIYIGHSVEDAAAFTAETFSIKRPVEEAEDEKTKPKPSDLPKTTTPTGAFTDDPVNFVKEKLELFITLAQKDPIEAVRIMPEVAGGIGGALALLIAIIVGLFSLGGSSAPSKEDIKKTAQKAKEAATDAKDKVAEATASGADAVKSEVSKRTTRSSGSTE